MSDMPAVRAIEPTPEEWAVLRSSVYPGAKDASIKMAITYCANLNLDVMLKPVHIVPLKVKTGEKDKYGNDKYEMRDVIMPGIGLYRIQAARNGCAGISAPEFGPTKTLEYQQEYWTDGPDNKRVKKYRDAKLDYPEWCKITVKRLVDGQERSFTAIEYWLENFGGKDGQPNAMWLRRSRGQLAKCTEMQALRRGFPEVGAEPTAEEMEGKTYDHDETTVTPRQENPFLPAGKQPDVATEAASTPAIMDVDTETGEVRREPDAAPAQGAVAPAATAPAAPAGDVKLASSSMVATVTNKLKRKNLTEDSMAAKFGFRLATMPMAKVNDVIAWASK